LLCDPTFFSPEKISYSSSCSFSRNNLLGEDILVVRSVFCGEDQLVGVIPNSEALATNEALTDKDTPPDLEYAGGLSFIYMAVDETFL
jgi:hypothetical protein